MDEVAAASHERAANAIKEGRFADEIVPVSIPQRKGDPIVVEHDEGVRPGTTVESLGTLRPAFDEDGTLTAGNASQISDGGSAVIVMSAELAAAARGVTPLGQFVSYGMVAGPDKPTLNLQPANAIRAALAKADLSVDDLALFELNEAFAAVGIASITRPRHLDGHRQRQRRRDRARPSDRHERQPARAHAVARAAAARRRSRRGGAVRRRRTGRRDHPPRCLRRQLGSCLAGAQSLASAR